MFEFVVFCVPTLVYLVVQSRGDDRSLKAAATRVGAVLGAPTAYAWALLLLIPLVVAAWLAIALIPADVLETPGVSIAQVAVPGAVLGIVLRAVGEEVFFRGLVGGVLVRRLGFAWGNLLQAFVFILPHLALLLVDARLWPILPVQFAAGWLLGWLRTKSGSFVPGSVVHVVANLAASVLTAG